MDETKHRWYVFTAKHAHFIVPFGIGVFAGAFGSVLTGAAPSPSSATSLPFFLSAIGGLTVAAIAALSAWTLAGRTDTLKRRRAANNARLRIRSLYREWSRLGRHLEEVKTAGWTDARVVRATVLIRDVGRVAAAAPNFDDLLDDEDDLQIAHTVGRAFTHAAERFRAPEDVATLTIEQRKSLIEDVLAGNAIGIAKTTCEYLLDADQHLAQRF